jgi:hypothetical protein
LNLTNVLRVYREILGSLGRRRLQGRLGFIRGRVEEEENGSAEETDATL